MELKAYWAFVPFLVFFKLILNGIESLLNYEMYFLAQELILNGIERHSVLPEKVTIRHRVNPQWN